MKVINQLFALLAAGVCLAPHQSLDIKNDPKAESMSVFADNIRFTWAEMFRRSQEIAQKNQELKAEFAKLPPVSELEKIDPEERKRIDVEAIKIRDATQAVLAEMQELVTKMRVLVNTANVARVIASKS